MSARNRPIAPSNADAGTVSLGPGSVGSARLPLNGGFLAGTEPVRQGRPISLPTTSGASAIVIHQLSQGVMEEIYLWCANAHTSNVVLSLNFDGDNSFPTATTVLTTIAPQTGLYLVWPGIPHTAPPTTGGGGLTKNTNPLIYAKASVSGVLTLFGYVVRHYPRDPSNIEVAGYTYGPLAE